jgi:hypothetical protein
LTHLHSIAAKPATTHTTTFAPILSGAAPPKACDALAVPCVTAPPPFAFVVALGVLNVVSVVLVGILVVVWNSESKLKEAATDNPVVDTPPGKKLDDLAAAELAAAVAVSGVPASVASDETAPQSERGEPVGQQPASVQ